MSETLVLTIIGAMFGVIQLFIAGLINRILSRLDALSASLTEHVAKVDCNRDMCSHSEEIRNLWASTRKNAEDIIRLKERHHEAN